MTHRVQDHVDRNDVLNWKAKAKHLIGIVCGEDSSYYKLFEDSETGGAYSSSLDNLKRMTAVFRAVKEDFEGGYLVSIRNLIQAEVFDTELEQASELLQRGYAVPAAVIAGVVLETAIRDLCTKNNIPHSKLDKMNADLVKAGAYNVITQKRVTHLAAIRNAAAHGKEEEFKTYDVESMISEVEQFLATHLS